MEITKSRTGMFGRDLEKRATRVLRGAWRDVGVESGDLQRSLRVEFRRGAPSELLFRIGATDWKAMLHHEGADPGVIRPVDAKVLRFPGKDGTMVFRRVTKPGKIKPNRYLLDNLRLAIM